MTRNFDGQPVERSLVERIVRAGIRSPTAGFTQGCSFLILDGPASRERFWSVVHPQAAPEGGRWWGLQRAPVLILPLADKQAYLSRYAEPDKSGLGMDEEDGWPAPYWEIDAAFATMALLLAATDAGLGAAFFAIARDPATLLASFAVPEGRLCVGAVALGWPAGSGAGRVSSAATRPRRPAASLMHWGVWG